MVTREEYLEALEIVKKYRDQIKCDLCDSDFIEKINSPKLLSDYPIPRKFQKIFGEIYLWNNDILLEQHKHWEYCFSQIKISDLQQQPFRLEDIWKLRGVGEKLIMEIEKIYKQIGVT